MSEEEVIAANRLIAIFMSGRFVKDQEMEDVVFSNEGDGEVEKISLFQVDALEFHKSWDWLMPVMDKIEKMGYKNIVTNKKDGYRCRLQFFEAGEYKLEGIMSVEYFCAENWPTKIEAVYWTIVKFLEW